MKRSIILIFGLFLLITAKPTQAQQDPMYSMYMFNGLVLNPAYAGSRDKLSLTAIYRHQWAGLEGAPNTASLSGHSPLLNDNLGIGITFVSDNISIFNTIQLTGSYAYRLQFKNKSRLAFGISASITHIRAKWSELSLQDSNDPAFLSSKNNISQPNFGAGIYYNSDKFYVGVSVPHFLNNSLSDNFTVEGTDLTARQYKHYFYTVGAIFKLGNDVKLKPSVLIKQVQNAPVEADINVSFLIKEALWLGASYRTGDAVVFMVEYMFVKQLRIGYAYDLTLTELSNYSSGSHEIMLGYEFGKKETYLTPRRMSYF